jgi:hypothetical protein
MAHKSRFGAGFTLGGEQAEADALLEHAFLETGASAVLPSRVDSRCFLVGRTGAGKSAALQHLEDRSAEHTIRINPEDLSLPYITGLDAIRYLDSLNINLDQFWVALWKHVLLVEIIRHRYGVTTPAAKQNFLQNLKEKIARDPGKQAALDYLEEFEGKFWCETDERIRDITDRFATTVRGEGKLSVPAGIANVSSNISREKSIEHQEDVRKVDRFQRIANDVQLAKLNKMIAVLEEEILDDQHFTYVVIDDLDRDWVDERLSNDLIRCLFRTVLDLKRVRNLKVVVALRSNIFRELDFGKNGGGQEEKFRSLILDVRWTRQNLTAMLDDRVRVAAEMHSFPAQNLRDILPPQNKTRGNPIDYILDRTLLRPRDAIAFVNEAIAEAAGKTRVTWPDIFAAEHRYSSNRLLALRDEWKPTYPGIEQVVEKFQASSSRIAHPELERILDEIAILGTSPSFPGRRWMDPLTERIWNSSSGDWWTDNQPLANFCFSIGLIGASTVHSAAPRFMSDDPLLIDTPDRFRSVRYFFVHRAYQSALSTRVAGAPYETGLHSADHDEVRID